MATNSSLLESEFGPSAAGRFDFTLVFEGAILSILPSALFFLLAPQRLLWLLKQPYKVSQSPRLAVKLVSQQYQYSVVWQLLLIW